MTYMIDARLEQGAPSVVLIDAVTGEERLHWRADNASCGENDWKGLFKKLLLLSCADQISLLRRSNSDDFGNECIECTTCTDQNDVAETNINLISTEPHTVARGRIASLLKQQR